MSARAYSVVGLGKLGASMAAAIAARGFSVVGVDVDAGVVDAVNAGRAPVDETGLEELIARNRGRLRATTSYEEAVAWSSLTFVVVPTPSDDRGAFALDHAADAFRTIGRALRRKSGYHTVVLTSTVVPGATRSLIPVLERASGRRAGDEVGVCYSPEFIALGSVIRDFLNPDLLLIGELDARAGDALEDAYSRIVENAAPVRRMTIENAELTKIALNTFVTTKIAFANTVADLCERIPGGDVDVVSDALGLDRRIGRSYLTGGLGYGGPCFPRDNRALAFFARSVGAEPTLAEATDEANRELLDRVVAQVADVAPPGTNVAVLGLAYKPGSNVVEESHALGLARRLAKAGARVRAYDPLVRGTESPAVEIELAPSLAECVAGARVVVVATPDPEFRSLTVGDLAADDEPVTVIDFWRLLPGEVASSPAIRYLAAGRGADDAANAERLAALWDGADGLADDGALDAASASR